MGRLSAPPIVLALAVAAALGLAACGSEDAELLPGDTASEINANLDLVRQLADERDCTGAAEAAATVSAQVEELGGVDAELKRALGEGATRLNEVVASCEEAEPEEEEPAIEEAEEPEEEEKEKPGKAERDEEKEAEDAETSPSLPPQAEGKAKGHEKQEEEAPAPVEPGGGTPSGGIEPAEPAEGGGAEDGG